MHSLCYQIHENDVKYFESSKFEKYEPQYLYGMLILSHRAENYINTADITIYL